MTHENSSNYTTCAIVKPKKRRIPKKQFTLKFFSTMPESSRLQTHHIFAMHSLTTVLDAHFPEVFKISRVETGFRIEYDPKMLYQKHGSFWKRLKYLFFTKF